MRSITEDQEAVNEELQSANEELLSGSEELQSLNEELETSREEIQTSNEELIIVNQELYERNDQLNLSRLYAESIVTTIREPLIVLNKDLAVRSANRSFYDKFQTTAEQTEGRILFELSNRMWDIPALRKMLENVLPEKTSIVDYEVTHNFPGLGERNMLLNATRIFKDSSDDESILLALEDITEQTKIEHAQKLFSEELEKQVFDRTFSLHEANIDLRNSNENLAQFAHIASHDLQEPLRKIKTFSTMLQDRYFSQFPDGAHELVEKIISSSERMSVLIKEVLNFSEILHGDITVEKADLNAILTDVIADFDLLITEKNAVIYRDVLPVIEAIPLQVKQLFYNLISNSLKFSKRDIQPVITIVAHMLAAKEFAEHTSLDQRFAYCEICFSDNGIGFQQQYADQIFLIFHRLNAREQFAGTGIGLALCKKIVINHHGEIYATATEGHGASFRIILPLTQ
jgi:two-component system CheB/CheR fusion protein